MGRIGIVPEHQLGCDGWDFVEDQLTITAAAIRDHNLTIQQQSVANVTKEQPRRRQQYGNANTTPTTTTTTSSKISSSNNRSTDQRAKGISELRKTFQPQSSHSIDGRTQA
jgi:hypothetical protein